MSTDDKTIKPRGAWQTELVREWREANDAAADAYPTREELIDAVNGYDAQLDERVGEGSYADGREHLRRMLAAGNEMLARARREAAPAPEPAPEPAPTPTPEPAPK